jgi:phosphatidylinositol 3-kinase
MEVAPRGFWGGSYHYCGRILTNHLSCIYNGFWVIWASIETHLQTKIEKKEEGESGEKMWQSLHRQTELTAQICTIMRDVKNVRGGTQKKIEKLRLLLSGLLSELTYFDEVI